MEAAMSASGRNRNNHPLPWLNLMATEPFYLLHFLTFFSYFAARSAASPDLSPELSHLLFRREIQAVLTFSVLVAIKIVKEETWDGFIADTLFYAKFFLFGAASIIDYHLALCYLAAFVGDSSHLTPLQLESLLTEGSKSRFWLVEFRALCSSTCIRTSRIFPDLSITYANKNLSFGIVDLGHFPNAAEKFGISLSVTGQLPTYILFDNASEVARLPDIIVDAPAPTITKNILIQHFELDRRLVEYISRR
ncbi:thioredoxin-related transmembrane protein 2 homolog isoform X2 [Asparagus officinalis]|uniref:thioredoxin-related transmembrane protein 2 homolog isoform X2 n=1 Tax=Asparagus officinalis TaxID=4686 RepID=UPI00098E449F|nr:thioredoxin-related transmembrane protein 2 homolog isoform X2 [Asparagus officinalis]